MEVDRLIKIIQNPSSIAAADIVGIKEILQKYPYFQLAYALVAKEVFHAEGTTYKDYTIQLAAIYATNRSHLKALLQGDLPLISPNNEENIVVESSSRQVNTGKYDFINGYLANISQRAQKEKINPKSINQFKVIQEALNRKLYLDPTPEKELAAHAIQTDLAAGNNIFHDGLATETLAKIMVQQGKIKRAIEIYEQLLLKIPEKKSYFVSILSELKNKM